MEQRSGPTSMSGAWLASASSGRSGRGATSSEMASRVSRARPFSAMEKVAPRQTDRQRNARPLKGGKRGRLRA
eukprot:scaffold13551_cov54-Phaeocystis_antarctica.AAC.3